MPFLKLKLHQIQFRLGLRPRTCSGAYSAPAGPLAGGEGLAAPPKKPTLVLGPLGLDTRPFSGKTTSVPKNIGPYAYVL